MGKDKIVLFTCEGIRMRVGIAGNILKFITGWRQFVSFNLRPLYSHGKNPLYL